MLILGSTSPRRKELLESAGIDLLTIKPNFDEDSIDKSAYDPKEYVLEIAKQKALSIYENYKDHVVLTADTIVVIDNEILGKPKDEEDAYRMLKKLSNRTHEVHTAVSIVYKGKIENFISTSYVIFNDITDEEIYAYISTKEPMDKAGAYAIQSVVNDFIKGFKGDFHTIMGLPLKEVIEILKKYPL